MNKSIASFAVLAAAVGTAAPASAGASTPAAPSGARVTIDDCNSRPQVEPKQIVLYCADAGQVLEKVRWSGWGRREARATAVEATNNCSPSCVSGKTVYRHVSLVVSGLEHGRYTKLTLGRQHFDLTRNGPVYAS